MRIGKLLTKLVAVFMICFAAVLYAGETEDGIVIAENGRAVADIVIPKEPSYVIKFAATELKQYLDKTTGGDFKITSTPTAPIRIRLGRSAESDAAGLDPEVLKKDGFFISAEGSEIFIVGQDNLSVYPRGQGKSHFYVAYDYSEDKPDNSLPVNLFHLLFDESRKGTLFGVYEFLERIGVRWPAPGTAHEVVPVRADIIIPEGTSRTEPFFSDRTLTNLWGFTDKKWPENIEPIIPDSAEYVRDVNDVYLWGLRLKLSDRSMVSGCHSQEVLDFKTLWAEQPERFSLIDGKRDTRYWCWTDPGVKDAWKQLADAYFSGKSTAEAGLGLTGSSWRYPFFVNPDEFMVDPVDHDGITDGRCRCERCNAFREEYPSEDDTELLWNAIAEVAGYIKEKHPGKFITTLVYPPKWSFPKYVEIPDNVHVRICVLGATQIPLSQTTKCDLELIKSWKGVLDDKPLLWTYQTIGRFVPGLPETYPHLFAEFLNLVRGDIDGMFFEQISSSHTHRNLDSYIAARLLWNPNRNIENELSEYFTLYYGPGAKPAQEFFKRLEDNWIKHWRETTPDMLWDKARHLLLPVKERQQHVWTQVYTSEEMEKIEALATAVETATAGDTVYSRRAGLLRKWILDKIKTERALALGKEEIRKGIRAKAPYVKTVPSKSDWGSAPAYRLISAVRMKQLEASGEFRLLHSGDTLYLSAEFDEPHMADTMTKKDRPYGDSEVWQDNDMEIFLYSEATGEWWQIIVNDHGNWASQTKNKEGGGWKQMEGFKVEVKRSVDKWTAEASIPLKHLQPGLVRFNLTRNRQIKGQPSELSTWSELAMAEGWHDPDNYGMLVF